MFDGSRSFGLQLSFRRFGFLSAIFIVVFFVGGSLSFFEVAIKIDAGERFFGVELEIKLILALRAFASVLR